MGLPVGPRFRALFCVKDQKVGLEQATAGSSRSSLSSVPVRHIPEHCHQMLHKY